MSRKREQVFNVLDIFVIFVSSYGFFRVIFLNPRYVNFTKLVALTIKTFKFHHFHSRLINGLCRSHNQNTFVFILFVRILGFMRKVHNLMRRWPIHASISTNTQYFPDSLKYSSRVIMAIVHTVKSNFLLRMVRNYLY